MQIEKEKRVIKYLLHKYLSRTTQYTCQLDTLKTGENEWPTQSYLQKLLIHLYLDIKMPSK